MQLSEWNIFCHGWQNWRQNPPGMKPISTSPIRQSGQGFWKEVSVRPKMDRKEGWNELDSEKAKIKREIGIWRYNDYSESFSVLITQSTLASPLDSEIGKKRKQKNSENDFRKKKTIENEIFWQESYWQKL